MARGEPRGAGLRGRGGGGLPIRNGREVRDDGGSHLRGPRVSGCGRSGGGALGWTREAQLLRCGWAAAGLGRGRSRPTEGACPFLSFFFKQKF